MPINHENEILIIDDDPDIRLTVCTLLSKEGYKVTEASDGNDGINKLSQSTKLVILDVMMPGKSGYETCQEIRRFSNVPILFLTAKTKENDILLGFHSGADDYLVKPFSFPELSARIDAILRRCEIQPQFEQSVPNQNEWLEFDNLKVNLHTNRVLINNEPVNLTETEYEILLLLMNYPNKIFSIQNIYESIWKEDYFSSYSNSIMVHIRNLRCKIEATPETPKYVITVWGKGYRFGH